MEKATILVSEILAMPISHLKGNLHREFTFDCIHEAEQTPAIVENLSQPLNELKAAAEEERQLALIKEKTGTSAALKEAADDRQKAQTAFKAGLRAMMGSEDEQVRTNASKLFELAHNYDVHAGDSTDAQTEDIRDLIDDIEQNYMDQLESVGFVQLFNSLKAKNERVCELRRELDKENSMKVDGQMAAARHKTDEAYRRFIDAVNVFANMQGASAYAEFMAYMNELITRYKRYHLKQSTNKPAEDTTDDKLYKATFVYDDPEVDDVVIEAKAGSELTAPQPSEGKKWAPNVPAKMPAEDSRYHEVPLDQEEEEEGEQGEESTKKKLTWEGPNHEVVATHYYEPGEHIVPPEPPAGYIWNYHPNYMPDHDLTVGCLKDED